MAVHYIAARYVETSHRVQWLILLGVVLFWTSSVIGQFGAGWTFLYPLAHSHTYNALGNVLFSLAFFHWFAVTCGGLKEERAMTRWFLIFLLRAAAAFSWPVMWPAPFPFLAALPSIPPPLPGVPSGLAWAPFSPPST
ncbi:MAG: hypothetical protein QJR00_01785 [Bacillota bacterium]|nr:hypothetical protein [Bacillota bacterium]